MKKVELFQQFASRLRDAMIAEGFHSKRSTSGVCIHKLAEITGYSVQICRKYLRGEALPEIIKLVDIATKLNVSPGWLLFGDAPLDHNISKNELTISKNLLHYLLIKAGCLYNSAMKELEVPDFLMELINDISHINASEEQSKKIIDLALSSATHFSQSREK